MWVYIPALFAYCLYLYLGVYLHILYFHNFGSYNLSMVLIDPLPLLIYSGILAVYVGLAG